ncbi:MAG: SLBB domain-containing protein [Chitinophagaceae bacterium]|nr:SLBB domain-containing protein [Chitinophagaceae bacterium]
MVRFCKVLILVLVLVITSQKISAQSMPMNIENLTDQQLIVLMSQYQLFGLSDTEMDMKAREKGLSADQIALLKKRMAMMDPSVLKEVNTASKNTTDPYEPRTRIKNSKFLRIAVPDTTKSLKVFGASIFDNADLSFEPNLNIATPQGYIIGVGDQLLIDIYGVSDNTKKLKVTAEGDLRFPNLGPIKVAGLTVEEARLKMKKALTKIYPGIANGSVSVQISVGQIRSIQVSLIGEIKYPGNYDVSSLSTIMNALYTSGGPNAIGSFRNIELVRNGKSITVFDLYDFLLKSDLTKNFLLQDGDVIRVNPYQTRVALKGAVKKPALFDVKPNETATDILNYAGGFADIGYKEMIRVIRFGVRSRELITVKATDLMKFKLVSGDTLIVDTISNLFDNRVTIDGAVYHPGAYGIAQMPNLKDLLEAAKPQADAYTSRAIVRRLKPDLSAEFINFNISDVLSGKTNIPLVREDSIQIYHINELREKFFITVNGEVNKPGTYDYYENMSVQDLVLMAKGYKDGASLQKIEISRRLRPAETAGTQKDSAVYSMIKEIDLTTGNSSDLDYKLTAFDIVSVRRSPIYKEQITATIEGEVIYPGNYTLAGNAERISDLVKRAGGLKLKGFAGGAVLIRKTYRDISENDAVLVNNKTNLINAQSGKDASIASSDTTTIKNLYKEQKAVGIRLDKILASPGSTEDLFLLEGDILKVPKELQTIQTFGAVNVPKQIVYYDGISFKDAIVESGKYSMNASRKNAYVIYPNGQVRKTRNFLFIRTNPKIRPGTEIYVPAKRPKAKLSTGEAVGILSSMTAMVSVLVILFRK